MARYALKRSAFAESIEGLRAAIPIAIGYLPYGVAFGVLAKAAHLSLGLALLMSITVYAGTAQMIAVGMIQAGEPALGIVVATLLVNFRYLLMSAAISESFRGWKPLPRFFVTYYLSDETFAVLSARSSRKGASAAFAVALTATAIVAWLIATALGARLADLSEGLRFLGLDFALYAVFIALVTLLVKSQWMGLIASLSAVLALYFKTHGLGGLSAPLAAVAAGVVGFGMEPWVKEKSSSSSPA